MKVWALVLFLAGLWLVLVAPGSCIGGIVTANYARHDVDRVRALLPADAAEGHESLDRLAGHSQRLKPELIWSAWHHAVAGALLIAAAVTIAKRPRTTPAPWTPP
jgi:hypothetical protein